MGTLRDKILALAGLFQVATLVKQLGRSGLVDIHDLESCIRSTFQTNPENVEAVFGGADNLRTGLNMLVKQLGSDNNKRDTEIARYVITLLHIERKLAKNKAMLNTIATGIEEAERQCEHYSITHENVLAKLADIYAETISLLSLRVMVHGEEVHLTNPNSTNKIRALLLSGIRAAVLWQQIGGSRWQLLFKGRAFVEEAERILKEEIPRTLN